MFKLDLEKAEEPEIKLPIYIESSKSKRVPHTHTNTHTKSKRVPEKHQTSFLSTMQKPLTVWITTKYGKFFKRWEYQTT